MSHVSCLIHHINSLPSSYERGILTPPLSYTYCTQHTHRDQITNHHPPNQSSHALFESLNAQKRKDDPISIARRQSMSEQRPSPGFIGRMWNKCVCPF
jgi:hypothetical protein